MDRTCIGSLGASSSFPRLTPCMELEEEDPGASVATNPGPDADKSSCLLKTLECDDDMKKILHL